MGKTRRLSVSAFLLLVLIASPGLLPAKTTTFSFPEVPWNGMKIDLSVSGNVTFGKSNTYPDGGRQDLEMCSNDGGPFTSLSLTGSVHLDQQGYQGTFLSMDVMVSIFYYPAGGPDMILVRTHRETVYAPKPVFTFDLTENLPLGERLGISASAVYCEDTACYPLILTATSYNYSAGPDPCFSIQQITPANMAENVDFDQPGISVTFNNPVDLSSVKHSTFQVYYWDENDQKVYSDGTFLPSNEGRTITFAPDGGKLLDGVLYGIKVWGRSDAQAPDWIKGARGQDLPQGREYTFWTMPDLTDKIVVVPVQSVENTELITGKPTVVRVFLHWDAKPQVNPIKQLETLKSDVRISWFGSGPSRGASWRSKRLTALWTPPFGTPIKREYRTFTTTMVSYSKREKIDGLESVNFYGYNPSAPGSVNFLAEVTPFGQKTRPPRTFLGQSSFFNIRTAPKIRYGTIPIDVGDWSTTGCFTSCPPGVASPCVDLQAAGDLNHYLLRDLFPFAPQNWGRTRNLAGLSLRTPANPSQYAFTKGTDGNLVALLRELNSAAEAAPGRNKPVYVGVVPRHWMDCGITFSDDRLGREMFRRAILLCHNPGEGILAHEMGHLMRSWNDEDPPIPAGEGFRVARKKPQKNSVNNLPELPSTNPINNVMYKDINTYGSYDYWLTAGYYRELYESNLVTPFPPLQDLQAGEPLLLAAGSINTLTNSVIRDPWYLLESDSSDPPASGEYQLVFLDQNNVIVGSYPFAATPPIENLAHFILKIPFPGSTARVQIRKNNTVIDDFAPSSQSPSLAINAPLAGAAWSGTRTVSWTAGDGNGDPLWFIVYWSTDGGSSWETLGIHREGNSLVLDTRGVP
ncbi:MAG: Ig-like domain-containing protein, partial [Deltaproteobacteria bacterium]|nr:Ig-like domain-containing protein [Deltaproteobacteria bacterium]